MSGWTPDTEELTPEEEAPALAGEYVLGLLEGQELRAFEARLAVEPALRAQVARWSEDFASVLDEVPPVPPPTGAEAALMRRLFPVAERPGLLQRLGLLPLLLGGAVAAALAVVAVNPNLLGRDAKPDYVARIAAEDESLVVEARFDLDTRRLEIMRMVGSIPEGRDLELWLVEGEEVRSLGVIPQAESGVVEVSADLAVVFEGRALALSVEPLGGSPTGAPTGPVVAVGPLTAL